MKYIMNSAEYYTQYYNTASDTRKYTGGGYKNPLYVRLLEAFFPCVSMARNNSIRLLCQTACIHAVCFLYASIFVFPEVPDSL